MKILLIDNYDSFTYNLVHYFESLDCEVDVFRNDEITIDDCKMYQRIVLSPGPGLPAQAGNLLSIIKEYSNTKKILGICLGLQAIVESFGGKLKNLNQVFHGIATEITVNTEDVLYKGFPDKILVGRYHSWVASEIDFPSELLITSTDQYGNIMSISHKSLPIQAVQFHPESIMTPLGKEILKNWIELT